jgi:hypothetical protein
MSRGHDLLLATQFITTPAQTKFGKITSTADPTVGSSLNATKSTIMRNAINGM